MKNILLACGSGIVTSTHAANKLTNELNKRGYEGKFKITQCRVVEIVAKSSEYDFCVATAHSPPDTKCPVYNGVPLLSGVGLAAFMEKIIAEMEK